MKIRSAVLCGMLLFAPLLSLASEKIFVQVPATLDPAAPIAASVRRECGVEQLIGNHVFQQVNQHFEGAAELKDPEKAGQDKTLLLNIISVSGVGGGSWSGPKSMSLRVQLSQNGRVVQQTILRRHSTGGAFGGMVGTCSIMERIAVALAKDTARWMSKVMSNAHASSAMPSDSVTDNESESK